MMGTRLNAGTMAPATSDVDFGYAPMQSYVGGFEPGMVMPGDRPPLLQAHHHLYDSLDFASVAAAFPFQEQSLFSGSAPNNNNNLQQQTFSPQITMPMAPSPSMQLPMMTLPGVPTTGGTANDAYGHYSGGGAGFLKREDGPLADVTAGGGGWIGLNLGRRTYFSPADVLAVDRLLMRSRFGGAGAMGVLGLGLGAAAHHHHQPPRCQAEGCKADLSAAKHYHRRHKVCEYHAKAASVAAAGKQQRFCQQCSRFHVLGEFDEAKRSCRKRLTEHNRRRRKPAGAVQAKDSPPPSKKAETSMTSSYTSDHKNNNRSTAISPNASGFSCLLEVDNGQSSNATTAAPTTLSLAAAPPPTHDRDGALDTMLMQRHVVQRRDEQQQQQHFMMTSLVQSHHHHHHHHQGNNSGGNGNILSCSSASDHQNYSSCGNGGSDGHGMQHFFEVDFM